MTVVNGPDGEADLTYILPIRSATTPSDELGAYLAWVSRRAALVVVDGSPPHVFRAAHDRWAPVARHIAPDPPVACRNGKVAGVLTGLAHAEHEHVVIADDDVRYDDASLRRVRALLRDHDLVRPQNYFAPRPWHARWDTARTLLNRAVGSDFPGTFGVRRSALTRTAGYDGDVLFENLELLRTVAVAGGRITSPADLYVRRVPPTARHFLGQRVRQAYDEWARPWRLLASLAVVPLVAWLAARRRWAPLACVAVAPVLVAEAGRRRAGGRRVFPASASLLAPLWLAERALCSWVALVQRVRGGCPYGGSRLRVAAHGRRAIARRLAERAVTPS